MEKYFSKFSTSVNTKNIFKDRSNSGFTLIEMMVVIVLIGVLGAIATPSWLAFVDVQRLNTAQGQVYSAMRQAQSQAKNEKLTWQVSFREHSGVVQWAIHPVTINPSVANWNNLNSNISLDSETNLQQSNGIYKVQFDYRSNAKVLGRITLSSKHGGTAKRCVVVSTLLGAIRTAKERTRANTGGQYCY